MLRRIITLCIWIAGIALVGGVLLFLLARKEMPERITYGMSFSAPYVAELGLDHDEVFDAFVDDLGIRNFRLSAHWTLIEPKRDLYDFSWLDYEVGRAEEVGATVILGVGRRLPRWPECHVPSWADELSWDEQKQEILEYIEAVVLRYKDSTAVLHWQVENEPFLEVFAHEHCGDLDEEFLKEEIALVKKLDPMRSVLVTDSGNLGMWRGAYSSGDLFGTSVYVYFWNPELGQFKSVLPPWVYPAKEHLMSLLYGKKQTMLIELSLEPWLLEPVTNVPIETQFSRMNEATFDEILAYARDTRFDTQYLWGGEWWYWLRDNGHAELWEKGRSIFKVEE